jgi:hypothetical protein
MPRAERVLIHIPNTFNYPIDYCPPYIVNDKKRPKDDDEYLKTLQELVAFPYDNRWGDNFVAWLSSPVLIGEKYISDGKDPEIDNHIIAVDKFIMALAKAPFTEVIVNEMGRIKHLPPSEYDYKLEETTLVGEIYLNVSKKIYEKMYKKHGIELDECNWLYYVKEGDREKMVKVVDDVAAKNEE